MSETIIEQAAHPELQLGDQVSERTLLDQLIIDSKLYRASQEYQELLKFIVRLRNIAPFNAMLLHIQKPGLNYAATSRDWKEVFNRTIKEKARPLLIMWPFGPVALVYDVIDTEGQKLPKDAFAFYAAGKIDDDRIRTLLQTLTKNNINTLSYDQGDSDAGFIRRLSRPADPKKFSNYEMGINRNHDAPMSFVTIAHELGHLFLGHLGDDEKLMIPDRHTVPHRLREIEAESVAYLVSHRSNVKCCSQKYLNAYVSDSDSSENLDLYAITRAAGRIERLLHLS